MSSKSTLSSFLNITKRKLSSISSSPKHPQLRLSNPHLFSTLCFNPPRNNYSNNHRAHYSSTAILKSKDDAKDQHSFFQQQMMELQEETNNLYLSSNKQQNDGDSSSSSSPFHQTTTTTKAANDDSTYEEEMMELKKEREMLFGFTEEETSNWKKTDGAKHTFSKSFMEEVELARMEQQEQEQEQEEDSSNNHVKHRKEEDSMVSSNDELNQTEFTHLTPSGDSVTMVDVGSKSSSKRVAKARCAVLFPPEVMKAFSVAGGELIGPKGPIFATAKIAGIMGAKRTSDLIPLCHPLPLDKIHIDIHLDDNKAIIECECRVSHKTGVEMEALTGASIAALTIYDMVKAVSHRVKIEEVVLVKKSGGKRNIG